MISLFDLSDHSVSNEQKEVLGYSLNQSTLKKKRVVFDNFCEGHYDNYPAEEDNFNKRKRVSLPQSEEVVPAVALRNSNRFKTISAPMSWKEKQRLFRDIISSKKPINGLEALTSYSQLPTQSVTPFTYEKGGKTTHISPVFIKKLSSLDCSQSKSEEKDRQVKFNYEDIKQKGENISQKEETKFLEDISCADYQKKNHSCFLYQPSTTVSKLSNKDIKKTLLLSQPEHFQNLSFQSSSFTTLLNINNQREFKQQTNSSSVLCSTDISKVDAKQEFTKSLQSHQTLLPTWFRASYKEKTEERDHKTRFLLRKVPSTAFENLAAEVKPTVKSILNEHNAVHSIGMKLTDSNNQNNNLVNNRSFNATAFSNSIKKKLNCSKEVQSNHLLKSDLVLINDNKSSLNFDKKNCNSSKAEFNKIQNTFEARHRECERSTNPCFSSASTTASTTASTVLSTQVSPKSNTSVPNTSTELINSQVLLSTQYYPTPDDFVVNFEDGYIITPGKHKVYMNSFIMQCDLATRNKLNSTHPGLASISSYGQDIYNQWKLLESQVDRRIHQLSFQHGTDLEKFRRNAVYFILQQSFDWGLSSSTSHASILNIHRMLLHYVKPRGVKLTTSMFINSVFACLRMAIKHEETPERAQSIHYISKSMCKLLGISMNDSFIDLTKETTNAAEQECLELLKVPLIVPSGPDFLSRYLVVGNYPEELSKTYEELALYLISLALFSNKKTDQLSGTMPSLLAASALSLSVRIISATNDIAYESWPERLAVYTSYSVQDLKPVVRELSALLRNKPTGSEVLENIHPFWSNFDWK